MIQGDVQEEILTFERRLQKQTYFKKNNFIFKIFLLITIQTRKKK